jgi:hypothetical protein
MKCLHEIQNEKYVPKGHDLEIKITRVMATHRCEAFQYLLTQHADFIRTEPTRSRLLATAAEHCDDPTFIQSLHELMSKPTGRHERCVQIAVDRGNFRLAKAVFEMYQWDSSTKQNGRTLLGVMIQKSKTNPQSLRALDFLFSITNDSDEVFWAYEEEADVKTLGGKYKASLLHMAVGANEFKEGIDRGTAIRSWESSTSPNI